MKKYNLTRTQYILVCLLAPIWVIYPYKKKTWYEFVKGFEDHVHDYSIPYTEKNGKIWHQCSHIGCSFVKPPEIICKNLAE